MQQDKSGGGYGGQNDKASYRCQATTRHLGGHMQGCKYVVRFRASKDAPDSPHTRSLARANMDMRLMIGVPNAESYSPKTFTAHFSPYPASCTQRYPERRAENPGKVEAAMIGANYPRLDFVSYLLSHSVVSYTGTTFPESTMTCSSSLFSVSPYSSLFHVDIRASLASISQTLMRRWYPS